MTYVLSNKKGIEIYEVNNNAKFTYYNGRLELGCKHVIVFAYYKFIFSFFFYLPFGIHFGVHNLIIFHYNNFFGGPMDVIHFDGFIGFSKLQNSHSCC